MQSFAHTFAQTSGINATQKYNTKTTSHLQPKTITTNPYTLRLINNRLFLLEYFHHIEHQEYY